MAGRSTYACIAFAAALAGGCTKQGAASRGPEGGDGSGETTEIPRGAILLRYTENPIDVVSVSEIDFTSTGGGAYAQATLGLRQALAFRGGKDEREVGWRILGFDKMELDGNLAPKNGERLDGYVRDNGAGAWMIDGRGVVDHAASDSHPANSARLAELADVDAKLAAATTEEGAPVPPPGATLLKMLPDLLALPRLPADSLVVGKAVEFTEDRETLLVGSDLVLPTETTHRYDLVKVTQAATRVAEIAFSIDDWAGVETDQGDVELKNTTEGTLVFDLDRGIPLNLSYTREESLVAGDLGYDTTKIVKTQYEPKLGTAAP